jgi:hypothetical protein
MKKVSLFVAIIVSAFVSMPLFAQENFTEGPVSRIILIHIKSGHTAEFWNDIRQNLKPIYEEYKKQGVISDYHFFTKATTENPEDWSVGINLTYKNYAALDDLASRTDPITLKFYGSREARAAANMKRTEHASTVSSFLIRTVDPKPMTATTPTPRP